MPNYGELPKTVVDAGFDDAFFNGPHGGGSSSSSSSPNWEQRQNPTLHNVFILPLQDQVIFPHQKFGVSLGRAIFDELCKLPLLPCAVTQNDVHMHATEYIAESATLPGTYPLMCAYSAPHAPAHVQPQSRYSAPITAALLWPARGSVTMSRRHAQLVLE